ncbi:MAG TPA: hypothetical protein VLG50_08695 [Candidatus Saccharimonadales bacterium]|nr:hypothetical protein [Candidatus Saccharimonadales bacterium]
MKYIIWYGQLILAILIAHNAAATGESTDKEIVAEKKEDVSLQNTVHSAQNVTGISHVGRTGIANVSISGFNASTEAESPSHQLFYPNPNGPHAPIPFIPTAQEIYELLANEIINLKRLRMWIYKLHPVTQEEKAMVNDLKATYIPITDTAITARNRLDRRVDKLKRKQHRAAEVRDDVDLLSRKAEVISALEADKTQAKYETLSQREKVRDKNRRIKERKAKILAQGKAQEESDKENYDALASQQ